MKKNNFKSLMQAAVLICTPLVIASCDDVFGDVDNPIPSYMSVKKDPVTLWLKASCPDSAFYTRTVTAATGAEIVYTSTKPEIATVDEKTGKITAVSDGECKIIVTATGKDSNGRMTYQEAQDSFPVIVKDWRARIALTEDAKPVILNVADYVATPATTVDLTEVLDVWPALDTPGLKITYTKVENEKGKPKTLDPNNIITSVGSGKITLSGNTGMAKVIAKIAAAADVPAGYEITSFAEELETDTFTIKVKEGIAYMAWDSEKGKNVRKTMFKRDEGASKDNYTVLDNAWATALTADATLDAGTYYVTATAGIPKNIKVNGDVNFIMSGWVSAQSLVDETPNTHVLNVFCEANSWGAFSANASGDAVIDFKAINIYSGGLYGNTSGDGCGGFNKNGEINVYAGNLGASASGSPTHGYGIKGAVNLKGYTALASVTARGTNADDSYAIIGDVAVNRGQLEASSDYRAINGTVTATKAKQCDDTLWKWDTTDKTFDGTWADFTGTPTKKFVWANGEEEPEE